MSVPARPYSEPGPLPGQPSPRIGAAAALVAVSPMPMLLLTREPPACVPNDACLLLGVGADREDANGSALALVRQAAGTALDSAFQGAAPTCYDVALRGPGERARELWCNLYLCPIEEQGRVAAVLCILVDTTPQVLAQRRLAQVEEDARSREAAFSLVYSNMEEVAFHVGFDEHGRFRFESVNHAFHSTTGLHREDVVGKLVSEVIPEPSCQLVLDRYREAIARRATVRWEEVSDYPSGQKVGSVSVTPVFDAAGNCTALIGTVHDITELKRVESELRAANAGLERMAADLQKSEERLGFALHSAGEGVWDWDIVNAKVFYSKRWKELLGLGPDAPDDFDFWWTRMHPDDVKQVRAALQECLDGGKEVCTNAHRLWHEAGRWIWVQARGSVVARDASGAPLRMVGTIEDITSTTELRQELERSYDLLARLAQQVPGVLFQIVRQPSGHVTCPFISAMSAELFMLSPAEIQGDFGQLLKRVYRPDRARLRHGLRESASKLQQWSAEFRVALPGGGLCWRELNAKPLRMADGSVVWHGFVNDISERKRTEETIRRFNEKLERRAHYDPVTGLPNRLLFRDRLEQEMAHARGDGHGMALLFIDLDRFKEVNDLLGHDAGDALLAHAGKRIAACLREGDTVARLGGDEFTVILTESGEVTHAEQVAQDILDVLRSPFRIGIEQALVSASVGITLYPGDGNTPEELMRNADQAMYRAKSAGRNRLAFFEPAMQAAAMRRLRLTGELRRALDEHKLELFFQPIIDIRSGTVSKAEALLRWHRPGNELALPAEFIAIAEDTGMIHDIGNWVFYQAANWSRRWSAMLGRRFQVSINKSPVQFQHQGHGSSWLEYLERQGMPRNSIAVEITEGLLLNLSDAVFGKLHELQAGGIEVSIDDFGTGYSSMTYLKRLDIDYLKIDKSFVAEMLHDQTSQTITETIIVMAHKLGLKVIAEGVERKEQRSWLEEQGCDYLQGFLFGEPVDAARFERVLMSQPLVSPGPQQGGMTGQSLH